VPVLWYLAGLTCTEETFMIKAGAQRLAAELGLMLVAPDTDGRPRRADDRAAQPRAVSLGLGLRADRAPMHCPWGEKAFSGYLGPDQSLWRNHDASELLRERGWPRASTILVDQGLADSFLEKQLMPERLEAAAAAQAYR
jgi:S-formylglutathione hydrolase FrmB